VLLTPDDGVRKVTEQKWRRPMDGWVKLNTDAAFCEGLGAASAGVVIPDSAGKFILSAWRVIWGCASAEQAEAEAMSGRASVGGWLGATTHMP
jgi:hypothetical protein